MCTNFSVLELIFGASGVTAVDESDDLSKPVYKMPAEANSLNSSRGYP